MIRRVFAICVAEWMKYSRSYWPYLGLILIVATTAGSLLVYPLAKDDVSDFGFVALAVPGSMNLAGLLVTLVYAANLVVSEVDSGVIRTVLTRPVRRHEWLCAKLLHGMAYVTALSITAIITAWVLAFTFGELTGVGFGDDLAYAASEMYGALGVAAILSLPSYFAASAYAIFFSSITRRPAAAIGLAVGVWVLTDTVKHPLGIANLVFTTYLDQPWIVFQDRCNALYTPFFPATVYQAIFSTMWFALFAAAAIFIFARRSFGP
jgi:ABC-type transport system involved in multi-copper enzyme maturation permease subunit